MSTKRIGRLWQFIRGMVRHPMVWFWLVVGLLVSLCIKSVIVYTLGTLGLVAEQDARLFAHGSDAYTTHYTENTIATETYEFVLADGSHVKAAASELPRWPNIVGDKVKLGLLGSRVVRINGTFIAPMGLGMIVVFVLSCYLTLLAGVMTVWVRRHKISVEHVRASAGSFTAGALGASIALGLVVIPCIMLDGFLVPAWPLGLVAICLFLFLFLRNKMKATSPPKSA